MAFSQAWLALREPADHAARDSKLLANAVALAGSNAIIVDLGSGTGSTVRAFNTPVCETWAWRFIDSDTALLDIAQQLHPRSEQFVMNLQDIDKLPLQNVKLVTASALLDLMPAEWVSKLAAKLKAASVPFYAALNYNGHMHWIPANDSDDEIASAFNAHQLTDKGIGPALGPMSGAQSARIFSEQGFSVSLADSPWKIDPSQAGLHRELIKGIGVAANDVGIIGANNWVKARCASVAKTTGYIGHTDLLAVPSVK